MRNQSGGVESQIGRMLQRRYRLDAVIGVGAMGTVYRAWDRVSERACAVKMMQRTADLDEAAQARFRDEARIVASLCHPSIVEVYDQGEDADGTLYLAMELLIGQDLHSLLLAQPRLPIERALDIAHQIGSALHTVHLSGVIHRDIKPRNVFLVQPPGELTARIVKVIDFGLSKFTSSTNRSTEGLLIGTPDFLPPEAWSGMGHAVDARGDQWALAVVLYRMLSGRLPFEAAAPGVTLGHAICTLEPRPLHESVPELPPRIEAAILRALSKDKEQRFRSVLDFLRALHGHPLPRERAVTCAAPVPRPGFVEEQATRLMPTVTLTAEPEAPSSRRPRGVPATEQTAVLPLELVNASSLAAPAAKPPASFRSGVAVTFLAVVAAWAGALTSWSAVGARHVDPAAACDLAPDRPEPAAPADLSAEVPMLPPVLPAPLSAEVCATGVPHRTHGQKNPCAAPR